MKKYILLYLLINSFLFNVNIYSQNINEENILMVRSIIADKGIDEVELLSKLKTMGIDIENMTELEIIANKELIEEAIAELEEANNANLNELDENTFLEENPIIPEIDQNIITSEPDVIEESEDVEIENDTINFKIYG